MKIAIIGTGYVGLVTAVSLASKGNEVTCVDIYKEKVEKINKAEAPFFEEGLESLLKTVISNKKLTATTDLKNAILNAEMCFICVGTPSKANGEIDLSQIEESAKQIGEALKEKSNFLSIVVRSTVTPGTTENVVTPLIEKHSGKKQSEHFSICMVPEFLREGSAIQDFMSPDKLVIGRTDTICASNVKNLLSPVCPIIETSPAAAELIKYAANSFLATKISFANEIGNLCKKLGIDSYIVTNAIGYDPRIGPHFLNSGLGFGGSCFPKDIKALVADAKKQGVDLKLVKATLNVNKEQIERFVNLAEKKISTLKGKQISVLGLAFKPGTDDIRESPSIKVIGLLLDKGAKVKAFDPKAAENTKKALGEKIEYANTISDCLKDAELCLICTDWPEFKFVDFTPMKNKVVVDGRNILEKKNGIDYEGLYW